MKKDEILNMTKTVSDFLHFQKQIEKYASELELENERYLGKNQNPGNGNYLFNFQSDTDGSRRNSMVDRRQSVSGVNILNNNDLADTSSSSLHTLIFHGLQEDWMELNMETLEKKQMVLELNVRKVKTTPKIFYQLIKSF